MIPAVDLFLVLVAAIAATTYFVFASFAFGAGYQPTPRKAVERMLSFASVGPSDRLVDLGAGTGAIVFRAARRYGATVTGFEIEPVRVLILRLRQLIGGPRARVTIRWGNFFGADLSTASVVTCFLWAGAMERLRAKFEAELRTGTRVVSHWHPIPGWRAARIDPSTHVYLYRWPSGPADPPPPGPSAPSGTPAPPG